MFDKIIDKLTDYLKLKGEQIKLEIMGHVARVLAHVIVFLLISLLLLFFGLFFMLSLAVVLNYAFGSEYLGYVVVTGVLLVLLIVIGSMLRSGKVQKWFETLILKISEDE
jgi:hypothetical protein